MINFVFKQAITMFFIACSCNVMETFELADYHLSPKTCRLEASVKNPYEIKHNKVVKIRQPISKAQRHFSNHDIQPVKRDDSPNNEQMTMVRAFIKSSNSLFNKQMSDETEGDGLFESELNLKKLPPDDKGNEIPSLIRLKRFDRKTIARSRSGNGQRFMKNIDKRKLRKRRNNLGGLYRINRLRRFQKYKRNIFKPNKVSRYRKSVEKQLLPTSRTNVNIDGLDLSAGVSKNRPFHWSMLVGNESGLKKTYKRFILNEECSNPMKRSRCRKILTTIVKKSVNEGKTVKIKFPSTHKCRRKNTCPCSRGYSECAPRTTCLTKPVECVASTYGRCLGVDRLTPIPPSDKMCPKAPVKRKRSCPCGCGCPKGHSRTGEMMHPRVRAGSCGCVCSCGCCSLIGKSRSKSHGS